MKRSLYLYFALPLEVVNVHLDGPGLLRKATDCLSIEVLVSELLKHGLEEVRLYHVEGGSVVVEHRHRAVVCFPKHGGRVLLELGHAYGDISEDGFHDWLRIQSQI